MRKSSMFGLVLAMVVTLSVGTPARATVSRDGQPTKLVKRAKALGIKKAGQPYTFEQEERGGDLLLTVEVPKAWSERADSHFINPETDERYGVGLRATTDADQFQTSYDVPGVKITAASVTSDEIDSFDAEQVIADNAYTGCREGRLEQFDNGVYEGMYQTFSRCDGGKTAAVVVSALGRFVEIIVAGQALTKADLAAIDRLLRTARIERTSV